MRNKPYVAMIQDGGEASENRLERGKSVRGFLDQIDG